MVERYRGRVSGPLLDRIDLHVEVPAVTLGELKAGPGEPSERVAARVKEARERQAARFAAEAEAAGGDGVRAVSAAPVNAAPVNAALGPEEVRRHCALDGPGRKMLDRAFERLGLSARALERILKVSRTIADLAGAERIQAAHVAEAIQYRALDRRMQ